MTTEKWEYTIVHIGNGYAKTILNDWGQAGWELVSIINYTAYFKRKL